MKTLSYLKGMRTKNTNDTGEQWYLFIHPQDFRDYIMKHRAKGLHKNTFRLSYGWSLKADSDPVAGFDGEADWIRMP